jgi:hypothetical protein
LTYIRSGSVSHYFPVGSQQLFFSRTGFVYVKNCKNSENSSISQLCFLFVIYLRFIITLVKDMFDLQIDKMKNQKTKNCLQWKKVVEQKTTAHVLYSIKRKKYKTVCAELAFAKSPSTEWSWFCIELIILFLYLLCSYIIAILKECLNKSRNSHCLYRYQVTIIVLDYFLFSNNILKDNKKFWLKK